MGSPTDNVTGDAAAGPAGSAAAGASRRVPPAGLRLHHEGLHLDVTADDPRDLTWLAEFLAPAFGGQAPASGAVAEPSVRRVRLTVSPPDHARLVEALDRAPPGEIEALGHDGRFSRHACFTDTAGVTWAHGERWGLFFGVGPGGAEVDVVARAPGPRTRVALMRVVRELATSALTARGRLPLHAAAFGWRGRGVLVGGPKRAGKTTLLLHALRDGADFLSNDRVFADLDRAPGRPPRLTPMPTVVQLRDGTLGHHPDFAAALAARSFHAGFTLDECAAGAAEPARREQPEKRPGLAPAQLCRLTGATLRPEAPLGLVLLPHVDPDATGITWEPLDRDAAVEALLDSLMKPGHPNRHSPLFAPGLANVVIDPADEAARCRRLAASVPVMRCRLGPDATRTHLPAALASRE